MTKALIVVGGGVAGPVTAMALQRAGIDAVVYKAHSLLAQALGAGERFVLDRIRWRLLTPGQQHERRTEQL
jgi:2-polyprenyl-6-methoxyphenol hydroxylase-like FAD-dependent oxidoreductase